MSIYFHSEDRDIPDLDFDSIKKGVIVFCQKEGKVAGDINFIYCSDEYLLEMNKQYLNHDYYTDIITFNYNEDENISGDIFMSRDRIEENSEKLKVDPAKEFIRICAHGIFHLLGQNDGNEEEKAEMRQKEEKFIDFVLGQ